MRFLVFLHSFAHPLALTVSRALSRSLALSRARALSHNRSLSLLRPSLPPFTVTPAPSLHPLSLSRWVMCVCVCVCVCVSCLSLFTVRLSLDSIRPIRIVIACSWCAYWLPLSSFVPTS